MAKPWDRTISDQKNVEMTLDIVKLFDGAFIPNSSALRNAIGQAVIDTIRNRTQDDETSYTGKAFKNYSESYAESVEFKAYGKKKNDPNLTQTGDMLGLLTVKETTDAGTIKIGWNDELQSEKAHGHITGAVGVKRDFFGLSTSEVDEIKSKFKDQIDVGIQETSQNADTGLNNFVEGRRSIGQQSLADVIDSFFKTDEG